MTEAEKLNGQAVAIALSLQMQGFALVDRTRLEMLERFYIENADLRARTAGKP